MKAQVLYQKNQVQVLYHENEILEIYYEYEWSINKSQSDQHYHELIRIYNILKDTNISQFCEFLSAIYLQLFSHCWTAY